MDNAITDASWIGKAAHQLIVATGRTGKEANRIARRLADDLLDYGIELDSVDPRDCAMGSLSATPMAIPVLQSRERPTERQNRQAEFLV